MNHRCRLVGYSPKLVAESDRFIDGKRTELIEVNLVLPSLFLASIANWRPSLSDHSLDILRKSTSTRERVQSGDGVSAPHGRLGPLASSRSLRRFRSPSVHLPIQAARPLLPSVASWSRRSSAKDRRKKPTARLSSWRYPSPQLLSSTLRCSPAGSSGRPPSPPRSSSRDDSSFPRLSGGASMAGGRTGEIRRRGAVCWERAAAAPLFDSSLLPRWLPRTPALPSALLLG